MTAEAMDCPAAAPLAPEGPTASADATPGRPAPFLGRSEAEALALFEANRGLVHWLARRRYPHHLHRAYGDDMLQAGLIGLWYAARTFDPARGAFTTYATMAIGRRMVAEIRRQRSALGPRDGSAEGVPVVQMGDRLHEVPVEDRGETLDDLLHRTELGRAMAGALANLRPADRTAVLRNVAHGERQEDVAAEDGVSRQRVAQRVSQGLQALRADERLWAFDA